MNHEFELQHNINQDSKKYTGKGIKIVVMDASFNVKHPAISRVFSDPIQWYDGFQNCNGTNQVNYRTKSNFHDNENYHGNHTVGLISGVDHRTGDQLGLAPEATIVPVCGMNCECISGEKLAAYLRALNYLKETDAKIINLSQELLFNVSVQSILIDLIAQGKIIVYAAGNQSFCLDTKNTSSCMFLQNPLLRKGLIVVGSIDKEDNRSLGDRRYVGSNYVSRNFRGNFIFANGTDRYSASGSDYIVHSGTSMAAPIVTGAIALLWQQNPHFTNEQIIQILIGSGTLITDYGHPKLNVANMLSKTTQEKILQSSVPEVHPLCGQQTMELFPDITICPNNFEMFRSKQLQGTFIFARLTQEDVIAFANTDLKYLREQLASTITKASAHAYYGLFHTVNNKKHLIMAVLALQVDNDIVYIADQCFWMFEMREQLMNELAYHLGQYDYRGKYKKIYANWGKFARIIHNETLYDLSKPNLDYFTFIHAKLKTTDNFPNIILYKKDIEPLKNSDFISFMKIENATLHSDLIEAPNKKNYIYATSANFHGYVVKLNEEEYHIKTYLNQDNQIIAICDLSIRHHWLIILTVLQTFRLKAKELGFEVFAACSKNQLVMPLHLTTINTTPKEAHDAIVTDTLITHRVDEIDFFGNIGDRGLGAIIPAFFQAIWNNNETEISYYLDNTIDLNNIVNNKGDNALHIVVCIDRNMNLIQRLVAADIDIFHKNDNGLRPIDLAKKSGFLDAVTYLQDMMNIKSQAAADTSKLRP